MLSKIEERLEILSAQTERTEIISLQEGMNDMKETIEAVMEKEIEKTFCENINGQ